MHKALLGFLVILGQPGFGGQRHLKIIHQCKNGGAGTRYSNRERSEPAQFGFRLVKTWQQGAPVRFSDVIHKGSRCKHRISGVQRINKLGKLGTVPHGNFPGNFIRQNAPGLPGQQFGAWPANHRTPGTWPG